MLGLIFGFFTGSFFGIYLQNYFNIGRALPSGNRSGFHTVNNSNNTATNTSQRNDGIGGDNDNNGGEKGSEIALVSSPTSSSRSGGSTNMMHFAATASGIRVGFISDLLRQLWCHLSLGIGKMIIDYVEPSLREKLPPPMNKIKFTKCDLGHNPLQLENICVNDISTDKNTLQFSMDIIWDGIVNIELAIPILAGTTTKLGVNKLKFRGRMQFIMKPLGNDLPCVSAIQYAFVNPPYVDLGFTGAAKVAESSVVKKQISTIIDDVVKGMVVLPNRMYTKLDPSSSYFDAYCLPLGFARITVVRGRGYQIERKLIGKDDIPDVYCNITLGAKTWRTTTIDDMCEPIWYDEVSDFFLRDYDQIININVWDEDNEPFDSDDFLGETSITVGELLLSSSGQRTKELPLHINNVTNDAYLTIHCEICKLTSNLSSLDTEPYKILNSNDIHGEQTFSGLLVIIITKAFHIPLQIQKDKTSTFIRIKFATEKFETSTVYDYPGVDCLNPSFDQSFHIPLSNKIMKQFKTSNIEIELINSTDPENLQILGTMTIQREEIINAERHILTDKRKFQLTDCAKLYHHHNAAKNETTTTTSNSVSDNNNNSNVTSGGDNNNTIISQEESAANNNNTTNNNNKKVEECEQLRESNNNNRGECELEFRVILKGITHSEMNSTNRSSSSSMKSQSSTKRLRGLSSDDDLDVAVATEGGGNSNNNPEIQHLSEADLLHNDDVDESVRSSSALRSGNNLGSVIVTIQKGWGFTITKKKIAGPLIKIKEIPDCYCEIKFGSSPSIWRTKTIKDCTTPIWDECREYVLKNHNQVISIDVKDDNTKQRNMMGFVAPSPINVGGSSRDSGGGGGFAPRGKEKFELLGNTKITVGKLLLNSGIPQDLELLMDGKPTGQYIAISCEFVK